MNLITNMSSIIIYLKSELSGPWQFPAVTVSLGQEA